MFSKFSLLILLYCFLSGAVFFVGESGFGNPESFCFWNPKSWATESRIQLKESGIPKLNLLTKNPESRAYNPQSKTVLNLLTKAKNGLFNVCHVPSLPFFFSFLMKDFSAPIC